jgi:hypothetical protein
LVVPACTFSRLSCRAAVKDGRQVDGEACCDVSRPLLDRREHNSMLVCTGFEGLLEHLASVGPSEPMRRRAPNRAATRLRFARCCYDHLAAVGRGRGGAGATVEGHADETDVDFIERHVGVGLRSPASPATLTLAPRDTIYIFSRLPPFVGRKNGRRKANALTAFADPVTHPWATNSDRTIPGQLVGMAAQKAGDLRLDSVRQQRSRAVA